MNLFNFLKYPLLGLIFLYKKIISPLLGPKCRFVPTCSDYAVQALKKYPFISALKLILKRISKCHPWGKYGYDPLP